MAIAYVGIGSNLDDPRAQVGRALSALGEIAGTQLTAQSDFYRTVPWGVVDQPEFVNAVARLETELAPRELMDALLQVESSFGRARNERWGPRVIDLDLLMHGDIEMDEAELHLPHPQMHRRAFVLVPLNDIAADLVIPQRGSVRALAQHVDRSGCVRIDIGASPRGAGRLISTNSGAHEKSLTDL